MLYTPWHFCSHNKSHHMIEKSAITPWLKSFPCSSRVFYISSCFSVHFVATLIPTPFRIAACILLFFSLQDLNSVYLTQSSTQGLEEIPQILHGCSRGHWSISCLSPLPLTPAPVHIYRIVTQLHFSHCCRSEAKIQC